MRVKKNVIGDEQVELAVAVVVDEGASGTEARLGIVQTCFFRLRSRERAVTVVVVQRILRITSQK